ncbi:MAG: hypothetical protein OEN56_02165 [Gemmatimonadota bacterium]|nr:hypothetical protein [Gemmatimonadota bacterium]
MNEPVELPDPTSLVHEACHEPFRSAISAIETHITGAVVEALRQAETTHTRLVAEAMLDGESPADWETRADLLGNYRRRVASDVLGPMRAALREPGPLVRIATELSSALEEANNRALALPREVESTWPEGALQARDSDSVGRRIGKFFGRVVSKARKAGEPRSVPVRAVAQHHLGTSVTPQIDRAAAESLSTWADWSRNIELAWIDWGDRALPALVRSELPDQPDQPDESTDPADLPWNEIGEAAIAFDRTLDELAASCPLEDFAAEMRNRLEVAAATLESDLGVAGSFIFKPADDQPSAPSLVRVATMMPRLEKWDDGVENRLHVYESLLGILAGATAVQRRLVWRVREDHLSGAKRLPDFAVALERVAQDFSCRGTDHATARSRLQSLEAEVRSVLEPTESAIPPSEGIEKTIQKGSDATVEALLSMVKQAPAALELHAEDGRLPRGGRKIETRSLALQELARQAFDAMRIERIRASTANLVGSIDDVRADIAELPNVFDFAFEAAKAELETGESGAQERAEGLAKEALLSMAESLRNAERSLNTAVRRAQARLATEVSDGALGLLDRVAAGRMTARLLAARSGFAELRATLNERWGPPVEAATHWLMARLRFIQRLASRGLRKGTEIVGTGPATGAASAQTLRMLADADAMLADLPLVYQRLFTLQPLKEPSLLAGRTGELADGLDRWNRWQSEDGIPLIVRGRPGAGVTTYLNILAAKIAEDGGNVVQLSLDRRNENEATLAPRLAKALRLEAVSTLDELAKAIFEVHPDELPGAVSIDNLEHTYLRVPGGTDLVERFLTLMSETEPRVFWIAGVTSSAWQLIVTSEPTATSQVDVLELAELSNEALREAVILRHRRSGLPLRYEEPEAGRRLLRRRLRRLRDREGFEELLADDFFVQLEKTSSRNLRLALFQWLRAADFEQSEGVLMHRPERPDFSMLDNLGLTQNFTLKAFLEHRTLSLEEHDRIFRLPRHESYQIFESLQNRHLIHLVPKDAEHHSGRSEIAEDLRYRVRPLLVGAVGAHLRGRNIVH